MSDPAPAPRPAARQRLGGDERRRQLIAGAVSVLARAGYRNTSLAAIAAEAGVSKGLLWHYFEDGDDLMEQTARTTLTALRQTVADDIDLSARVPDLIRAALRRAARLRESHRTELRALREILLNLRNPDGTPRIDASSLYEETYSHQATLFQRGQAEGSLRPDLDPHYIAILYQGLVDVTLAYLDAHPEAAPTTYTTMAADLFLTGIAT